MGEALRQGAYVWIDEEQRLLPAPNLDILPNLLRYYNETMGEIHDADLFDQGLRTIYREAIFGHITRNQLSEARALHEELLQRFPDAGLDRPFERYVVAEYIEGEQDDPSQRLLEAQQQSYLWRALNDADRADGYAELVRMCVEQLETRHGRPVVDRSRMNNAAAQWVLNDLRSQAARTRLIEYIGAAPAS